METTEILIKVELSPKVLEGLVNNKEYFCTDKAGDGWCCPPTLFTYYEITHIYLPLTVTTEMIKQAAGEYEKSESYGDNAVDMYKNIDFIAGVNWLLSLNKE